MKHFLILFIFISLTFFSGNHLAAETLDSLASEEFHPDTVPQQQLVPASANEASLLDESNKIVPRDEKFNFSLVKILRGLLGMTVLILLAWVFSSDRKSINWKVVFVGIGIQLVIAIGILWVPAIQVFFEFVGKFFVSFC